ncbi:MAG: helix-turn-helix domain-containing protein [Tenacibaculum sp.]
MTDKERLQKSIGKSIRELRIAKNIPQQDVAGACNIEKSNLSRIEAGNTNPTIFTLKKIADNLGVTLCDIVSFDCDSK